MTGIHTGEFVKNVEKMLGFIRKPSCKTHLTVV